MIDVHANKLPAWVWVVSGAALLWNLAGCAAYWMQMTQTPEALAAMSDDMRALYEDVPKWAVAAFAVGVWGGALGCIGLLLRKRWAAPVLVFSLVGVLAQMAHSFFMSDTFKVMGNSAMIMPIAVIAISLFLVWFSSMAVGKGWLR